MEISLPSNLIYKAKTRGIQLLQVATLAGTTELATHAAAPSGLGALAGLLATAFAFVTSNIGTHQSYKDEYYQRGAFPVSSEPSKELIEKHKNLHNYIWDVSDALKIRAPRLRIGITSLEGNHPDYDALEKNSRVIGNENYSVIELGRLDAEETYDDCKNIINHEMAHIINADSNRHRLQHSIDRVRNVAIPLALCLTTQSGIQTLALFGCAYSARKIGKESAALLNAAYNRLAEYQADKIGQAISQQSRVGKTFANTWRHILDDDNKSSLYDSHPMKAKRLARLAKQVTIKPPC